METTNLEGKLKEYIKHLYKARDNIEKEEDERMTSQPSHPLSLAIPPSTSEAITLGVIIRDLEKIAYPKDFSYWNA